MFKFRILYEIVLDLVIMKILSLARLNGAQKLLKGLAAQLVKLQSWPTATFHDWVLLHVTATKQVSS
jgi:hypothetical protein